MSVQVETIGYRFRVSQGANVFDIISITEMGITKSNETIRAFFDNFKILKSEKVVKQEEVSGKTLSNGSDEISKVGECSKVMPARKKRESMKNIWGNVRDLLGDEFTIPEYAKALRDAGYEYTPASWEAVPGQQIRKIVNLGKIEKVEGVKPVKYRKIKVPHSFRSDKEAEKTLKSLKEGKEVIMGSIR
jgi:hypothetical protein